MASTVPYTAAAVSSRALSTSGVIGGASTLTSPPISWNFAGIYNTVPTFNNIGNGAVSLSSSAVSSAAAPRPIGMPPITFASGFVPLVMNAPRPFFLPSQLPVSFGFQASHPAVAIGAVSPITSSLAMMPSSSFVFPTISSSNVNEQQLR